MTDMRTHSTGNLWFAMPRITAPPGGLNRLAFLMMAHRGLIELTSGGTKPWLAADAQVGDQSLFAGASARAALDWIPTFVGKSEDHQASLTWLAPHDERGWCCRMEVKNTSSKPFTVRMSYTLRWGETRVSTYVAEPLEGCIALDPDGWGGGIGLAWVTQRTEFALGIGCNPDGVMKLAVIDGDSGQEAWSGDPTQGKLRRFDREKTLVLSIDREITVAPSETEILDLFMSAAQDIKAACLDARYFGEMGFERLRISTQCQLDKLNANIPEAIGGHESLGPLVRRNRLFSYFYSLGRTLDTEEICPVTSRSSDYYVSAAYWDRDSLLWSFPTILRMDPLMAAEMMRTAFGRQGRNIGIHSRFIDGSMYEPGFELDELCAPVLALDRYIQHTGDWGIIESIPFDARRKQIEHILTSRRHPDIALFSTDYLPTDDLAQLPYCIYDNVLVWAMCGAFERIAQHRADKSMLRYWSSLREEVGRAIREHGVIECDGERMFAWSTDLSGKHRLYDEPPGSLTLLPWLGFCRYDDPAYQSTLGWIYSSRNKHYYAEADEVGCLHEPHPWVLAIANSLLVPSRRAAALSLLKRSRMDDGIACEAIDEKTGIVVSGNHFATCAGFLSNALVEQAMENSGFDSDQHHRSCSRGDKVS